MKSRLYIMIGLLLTSGVLFSRGIPACTDTTITKKDTSSTRDIEGLVEYDSTLMFPAFDIYSQWDTNSIHPYEFAAKSLVNDTNPIYLIDEYNCGYVHPFCGEVTSDFGPRKGRPHYGIDINLETGDSVGAAFSGMVRIAKKNKTFGNVVIIRHSNGLETFYAHLSKLLVNPNDYVEPGQIIGLGGNTGRSHGSHLHFEVRYKGFPIDPNEIISFERNALIRNTLVLTPKTFEFSSKNKGGKGAKGVKSKYYTVRKGDTLYGIARKYGTTPQKLCKLNKIKMTTVLRIGMKLKCA
jgi:murein DD-endopeptidase MepM/ murein hydrolase activator NlpD